MLLHNLITYKVAQFLYRVLTELTPYIYTIIAENPYQSMDTPLNFFNVPMYFVTFINGQEFSLLEETK